MQNCVTGKAPVAPLERPMNAQKGDGGTHKRRLDRAERMYSALVASGTPAAAGLVTMAVMLAFHHPLFADLHNYPLTALLFVWLFAAMIFCAFGVLHHAHALALLMGEPGGTLILTLAVTIIEVALLASITLHGGPNPTLARDTMFATLMLVLNGMVGTALLLGALRYREQEYNLEGARAFLVVLAPLAVFALIIPNFTETEPNPVLAPAKAASFALIAAAFYSIFLAIQTTRHRGFFAQPKHERCDAALHPPVIRHMESEHRPSGSRAYHAGMLALTLVPIVILSKFMALIVDLGIEQAGLPTALGGIMVAVIVLSPEALTAMTAALANHLQQAVNVCLGSALATLGLTIPAVLAVGMIASRPVHLGLTDLETVLLVLTLCVSALTFGGVRTTVLQGLVHLLLLVIYVMLIFSP
jgi:Ca2+:H+ antiporter